VEQSKVNNREQKRDTETKCRDRHAYGSLLGEPVLVREEDVVLLIDHVDGAGIGGQAKFDPYLVPFGLLPMGTLSWVRRAKLATPGAHLP
jgi:hypothetical protein